MSTFICEHCGEEIIDSPVGYLTGCEHFPLEVPMVEMQRQLNKKLQAAIDDRKPLRWEFGRNNQRNGGI